MKHHDSAAEAFQLRPLLDGASLAACFIAAGLIQVITSYPIDADTAYHAAVGWLIGKHGLLDSFPWTPFSWLSDNYADKELLFHLLFTPLDLDYPSASRVVGTVCGGFALSALYLVLRFENIPKALLWTVLPLACSASFVLRFAAVRPHLISIGLAILFTWAAARRKYVLIGIVSVLYPLCYVAFWQVPLLVLMSVLAASLLSGERLSWKPVVVTVSGIVLGVLLHPNTMNLLKFNWLTMSDVLVKFAWTENVNMPLGTELRPASFAMWCYRLFPSFLMMSVSLRIGWKTRKDDSLLPALALATLIFFVLTAKSSRFLEYFVPFSVLSMAVASVHLNWRRTAEYVTAGCLLYTGIFGFNSIMKLTRRGDDIPPVVATALQRLVPPGSQVFTPDWHVTGSYMLALPDRKFIVALDPTLLYKKDPLLYRDWDLISSKGPANSAELISERFGARYVLGFLEDRTKNLVAALNNDNRAKLLFQTRIMFLYEIAMQEENK